MHRLDQVHGIRLRQTDPAQLDARIWTWCRTTAWAKVKCVMRKSGVFGASAMPKGLRHGLAVESTVEAYIPLNVVQNGLGMHELRLRQSTRMQLARRRESWLSELGHPSIRQVHTPEPDDSSVAISVWVSASPLLPEQSGRDGNRLFQLVFRMFGQNVDAKKQMIEDINRNSQFVLRVGLNFVCRCVAHHAQCVK